MERLVRLERERDNNPLNELITRQILIKPYFRVIQRERGKCQINLLQQLITRLVMKSKINDLDQLPPPRQRSSDFIWHRLKFVDNFH